MNEQAAMMALSAKSVPMLAEIHAEFEASAKEFEEEIAKPEVNAASQAVPKNAKDAQKKSEHDRAERYLRVEAARSRAKEEFENICPGGVSGERVGIVYWDPIVSARPIPRTVRWN